MIKRILRIAIVGLGQIGGSLAWALGECSAGRTRADGLRYSICGFDKNKLLLEEAVQRGIIDTAAEGLDRALAGADLVVLATPVSEIIRLVPIAKQVMKPGAVLFDVGSTKKAIVSEMEKGGGMVRCIGGHPITGTERPAPESWDRKLFSGRMFVIVRTRTSTLETEALLTAVLSRTGARFVFMEAGAHDHALALTSHLPFLMGCALVLLADKRKEGGALPAGGAFRSATRVVASPPKMSSDICLTNVEALREAYEAFDGELRRLLARLQEDREGFPAVLEELRKVRDRMVTE